MWTIRLAALAADNEKQTAGYVHDSSKRNDRRNAASTSEALIKVSTFPG